jgi:hypothetical protein
MFKSIEPKEIRRTSLLPHLIIPTPSSPLSFFDSDDQGSVLKELFSDHAYVEKHNICSINSINWARIAAQSTYYVWAYLQVESFLSLPSSLLAVREISIG